MATKKKSYTVMRRFYIEASWKIAASSLEEAVLLLKQAKPADVIKVNTGVEVNDWGSLPGYDGAYD